MPDPKNVKRQASKKPIEQYAHLDKEPLNNPLLWAS